MSDATHTVSHMPLQRCDLRVHELDGDALIYDMKSADTHRLNVSAAFIWRLCDGRHDVDAIIKKLTGVYDVTPDAAREHVERILGEFSARNLFEAGNEPIV